MTQHALFIGRVWPEPGSSAAGSRTLQLIAVLQSAGWKVSFASAAGDSEFAEDLSEYDIATYPITLNSSSFDEWVKDLNPGLVVFDRFMTEEQYGWRVAEHCPSALRVLDTIDLHCLRLARQVAVRQNRELRLSDLFSDTAKREIAAIYRCDLSLMISSFEMQLLESEFNVPKQLLHYIPFLVEPESETERSTWPAFSERKHFMTIGNFLHEPNWDSVLYLKKNIWPLIRKQLPSAELWIYGSYASQKVNELHNVKEGFLIKGRAESVAEVMKQARICLAPLRFGAGMKGKLLDAMLYGTPSVTTPVGAESMHGDLLWNGSIGDSPEAIAEAAVKLYQDEGLWQKSQEQGFHLLRHHFSLTQHSPGFLKHISDLQNELETHRLHNFTGAMLQQQQIAATKYMSLWIEAKQKNLQKIPKED